MIRVVFSLLQCIILNISSNVKNYFMKSLYHCNVIEPLPRLARGHGNVSIMCSMEVGSHASHLPIYWIMVIIMHNNWGPGQSRQWNLITLLETRISVQLIRSCNTQLDTHIPTKDCYHLPLSNGSYCQTFYWTKPWDTIYVALILPPSSPLNFSARKLRMPQAKLVLELVWANFTLFVVDHEADPWRTMTSEQTQDIKKKLTQDWIVSFPATWLRGKTWETCTDVTLYHMQVTIVPCRETLRSLCITYRSQ